MKIEFKHIPKHPEYLTTIEKDGEKYNFAISKTNMLKKCVNISVSSSTSMGGIVTNIVVNKLFLNEDYASDEIIKEHLIIRKRLIDKTLKENLASQK
jgi:hypothetical protein